MLFFFVLTIVSVLLPHSFLFQDRKPLLVTVAFDGKSYKFKHTLEDMENGTNSRSTYSKKKSSVHERKRRQTLAKRLKPFFRKKEGKREGIVQLVKRKFSSEKGVHYLDQYSRILFPLGYAAFLTAYFVIYMA